MAASLDARDQRRWAGQGLTPMPPHEGVAALQDLLDSGHTQVAVLAMDWRRYREQFVKASMPPFLSRLAADPETAGEASRSPRAAWLRIELEDAAPRKRMNLLLDHVRRQAITVLGLPAAYSLDAQQGLRDLGLDSLLALELRSRLQAAVGEPLPATLAFDCPTVADMARYLAEDVLSLELPAATGPAAAVASSAELTLDELDQLSDEMAEALLNAELSGARVDAGKQS